jgi:hypothetical protein
MRIAPENAKGPVTWTGPIKFTRADRPVQTPLPGLTSITPGAVRRKDRKSVV